MRPRLCCSLVGVAVGLSAPQAEGQIKPDGGAIGVRIDYEVAPGCPGVGLFLGELGSRLPSVRLANIGEPATGLIVRALRNAEAVRGTITQVGLSGTTSERSVDGAECGEVVRALALIAAVALTGATQPDDIPLVMPESRTPGPPRLPELPESWGWSLGTGARVAFVGASQPFWGPTLSLGVERDETSQALALLNGARVSGFISANAHDDAEALENAFQLFAGRAQACPLLFTPSRFRLLSCVLLEAGAVRGEALIANAAVTEWRAWVSPGLSVQAAVALSERFRFELSGHVSVPLQRYRFYVDPDQTIFTVNPISTGLDATFLLEL